MPSAPQITVLMPVYNTANYVEQAIRSVLDQTFGDFELLIFNDGSKDDSSNIVKSINDKRIKFFDYNYNSGYVKHLNYGLSIAKGKYIARMDSDDISLPERFAKQIAFMEGNSTVGVCGTAYQMFGSQDTIINMPVSDTSIREFMLLHNPLGHPTVMMRKSVLDNYGLCYKSELVPAEDYRMWYDFSKVSKLANLAEVLVLYRTHDKQISSTMNNTQRDKINDTRWAQLYDKGFNLSAIEIEAYCNFLDNDNPCNSSDDLLPIASLINNILAQNNALQAFPAHLFVNLFKPRWENSIYKLKKFSPKFISVFRLADNSIKDNYTFKKTLFLYMKSLLSWHMSAQ